LSVFPDSLKAEHQPGAPISRSARHQSTDGPSARINQENLLGGYMRLCGTLSRETHWLYVVWNPLDKPHVKPPIIRNPAKYLDHAKKKSAPHGVSAFLLLLKLRPGKARTRIKK
jgi:hypothetical protein